MPLTITKQNGKFCVTDPAGKNFGCHATKKGAVDQIGAIESNKAKSGVELESEHRNAILDAYLKANEGIESPPIMIASNGTPEGTVILIHGRPVLYKHIDLHCSRSEEYPHCSINITMDDTNEHGMIIERTLTLRKEPPPQEII